MQRPFIESMVPGNECNGLVDGSVFHLSEAESADSHDYGALLNIAVVVF